MQIAESRKLHVLPFDVFFLQDFVSELLSAFLLICSLFFLLSYFFDLILSVEVVAFC
jgi:hypothetical protein